MAFPPEFKPANLRALSPYTGPDIHWEEEPEPVEANPIGNQFPWVDLNGALRSYASRIHHLLKDNFYILSLYTILQQRIKYPAEAPIDIAPEREPLAEFKGWQALIKTIKFHSPTTRNHLPPLVTRGDAQ